MAQARRRGTRHGRPPIVAHYADAVRHLFAAGLSKSAIARRLAISRASVRRFLGGGGLVLIAARRRVPPTTSTPRRCGVKLTLFLSRRTWPSPSWPHPHRSHAGRKRRRLLAVSPLLGGLHAAPRVPHRAVDGEAHVPLAIEDLDLKWTGERVAALMPLYGHTVVPRLRTVASQVMVPMVMPPKVTRVPNLRSTSVPLLCSMLDGFDCCEAGVRVPAPSASRPV